MLINANEVRGYELECKDGEIGSVKEFYFDDEHWTIRYLVVNAGSWLVGRQVLLSPYALVALNTTKRQIDVDLTKKQVEDSPPLSADEPVSRQFEENYFGYYGWPMWWGGPYMWGSYAYIARGERASEPVREEHHWDPHLRSTHDVAGHHVQAADGVIGHIVDFIIDEETWAIRYLVVDTQNWWPGRKVLISSGWIDGVSWDEKKVFVNVTRDKVKQAPEYVGSSLPTRNQEEEMHRNYDRRGYWMDESPPAHRPRSHAASKVPAKSS